MTTTDDLLDEVFLEFARDTVLTWLAKHTRTPRAQWDVTVTSVERSTRPLPHRSTTMAFQLGDDQHATLSLQGVDDAGNHVPADATLVSGPPVWDTADTTILTLTPAADGMSCEVRAVGPTTTGATVTVTGTLANPPSSGPADFSLDFVLDVVTTAAISLAIDAGTPVHN